MVSVIKVDRYEFKSNCDYSNTIVLSYDNWDDFGYKTTLNVKFYDQNRKTTYEGQVHIYNTHMDTAGNMHWLERQIDRYLLDGVIGQLDNSFCSLGSELNYYIIMKKTFPHDYQTVLDNFRDVAFNKKLWNTYKGYDGVKYSLLRSSSALKALNEAYYYLNGLDVDDNDLSFNYEARVPYSDRSLELKFNFKKDNYLPYRICAIIGKNGVGKTHIIQDLAIDISGFAANETEMLMRRDRFISGQGLPRFNKVISISFSVFDPFIKKQKENSLYSYVYCGIQSEEGVYSISQIRNKIKENLTAIVNKNRFDVISRIVSEIFQNENDITLTQILNNELDGINLSSGESIILYSMTEAVLNIEKESIVLFDEPELHLHPNAIANIMRMLNSLLEEFDSYAIISTHSPIILQELPSKNVLVLQRVENIPQVLPLGIESFGESISIIVKDAFPNDNRIESLYQTIFADMKKAGIEKEIVKSMFDGKLGLNALISLESIYSND